MVEQTMEWPPLESNPEVFTDYMHQIGMSQDWVIQECYGFDDDMLGFLPKPVIAVIATFESLKSGEERAWGDITWSQGYYMK